MKRFFSLLLLGFFLLVPRAYASLSFVSAQQGNSAVASSITVSTTIATGDLIVVDEANGSGGISNNTPTDSAGTNTWLVAASSTPATTTNHVNIYYATNVNAVTSVTCNFSTTVNTASQCIVYDISGAATSNVLDATSTGGTASSVPSSTSGLYTTTNANDILLFGTRIGNTETTWIPASPFIIPNNATSGSRGAMSYSIVSSIQTNATTSIGYNSAQANSNAFASFKASGPTPGPDVTSTVFSVSGALNVAGAMTINY